MKKSISQVEFLIIVIYSTNLDEPIERLRQGEFTGDIQSVISIAGTLGNYYLTN